LEAAQEDVVKANINTILMATDFMQSSRLALDYAIFLARRLNSHLVIVHAIELGPSASHVETADRVPCRARKDAAARLQAFVEASETDGVPTDSIVVEGTVTNAVTATLHKFNADLLVMGTQGVHRGLDHLLTGSNTETLMMRSPCPALTIGPHVLAGVGLESRFKKVIYISNFSPASAAAAPYALQANQVLGGGIEIYQVVRDKEKRKGKLKELVESYCARLKSFESDLKEEWYDPAFEMGRIISPEEALEKSLDPSVLMVVGAAEMATFKRHLSTSYPYRLLATAACPILTVRSEAGTTRPLAA
jgi:nucleotide-binding universal stress UspA family protein